MMTPRLNKQHQWLPSCFDVNWQVFNLSNLMHDLNGGSSRMKTFPFQRLSTFLHIFLIFLRLPLRTLSTSALGLKNSEPGPMPKVLKGKNDLHLASFDPCNILHEPWQWQWLPISEEVTKNILFCCSCFALVSTFIVVFRQRVLLLL